MGQFQIFQVYDRFVIFPAFFITTKIRYDFLVYHKVSKPAIIVLVSWLQFRTISLAYN